MDDFRCTFCGASRFEVAKIIAGRSVFICQPCAEMAHRAVAASADRAHLHLVDAASAGPCPFCGSQADPAEPFVSTGEVGICGMCLQLCNEILADASV